MDTDVSDGISENGCDEMDMEKVIKIIDELIFEAQKEPTWNAENALRCLKKELLKEQEVETEWCERCGRVRLKSKWEGR